MNFKTTEFTLGEAILAQRIKEGDMTAVAELLKSRSLDPDFDPLGLSISEVTKMMEHIVTLASEHVDEVGAFVNKIKLP